MRPHVKDEINNYIDDIVDILEENGCHKGKETYSVTIDISRHSTYNRSHIQIGNLDQ